MGSEMSGISNGSNLDEVLSSLDDESVLDYGIDLFNNRSFYRCHDVMEHLWGHGDNSLRDFYRGILQIAVALYHLNGDNLRGAVSLLESGTVLLRGYSPQTCGLDVDDLIFQSQKLLGRLKEGKRSEDPGSIKIKRKERSRMKRITMIFGSPRKFANSETLAEAFVSSINKTVEIDRFHTSEMNIRGCMDCRKCWTGGKPCIIEDEMDSIYGSLCEADLIIFATPLYWFSWSAQIKPVIDRLLPFMSDDALTELNGKKAVLIASAGDENESCYDGLRFSFRESCSLLGLQVEGEFCKTGLYPKNSAACKPELIKEIREAGKDIFNN